MNLCYDCKYFHLDRPKYKIDDAGRMISIGRIATCMLNGKTISNLYTDSTPTPPWCPKV